MTSADDHARAFFGIAPVPTLAAALGIQEPDRETPGAANAAPEVPAHPAASTDAPGTSWEPDAEWLAAVDREQERRRNIAASEARAVAAETARAQEAERLEEERRAHAARKNLDTVVSGARTDGVRRQQTEDFLADERRRHRASLWAADPGWERLSSIADLAKGI